MLSSGTCAWGYTDTESAREHPNHVAAAPGSKLAPQKACKKAKTFKNLAYQEASVRAHAPGDGTWGYQRAVRMAAAADGAYVVAARCCPSDHPHAPKAGVR